jgi:hypothetical protein
MNSHITFAGYLKTLKTVFYAFLACQFLLAFFTVYMVEAGNLSKNTNLDVIFKYALPIVGFGLVLASFIFFKIKLRGIEAADSLSDKLIKYKLAFVIKYALMNAVAVFSLVACLTTQNYQYLILLVLITIIQLMSRSSSESIIAKLKLSEEERIDLLAGKAIAIRYKEKSLLVRYPVFLVVLIGFSIYSSYDALLGLTKKEEWSAEEKEKMVQDCILKAKDTAAEHPQEVKEYCVCSNEAIFKKFTREQMTRNNRLPAEELMKTLTPIFTECLNDLKAKISAKKKSNNEKINNE